MLTNCEKVPGGDLDKGIRPLVDAYTRIPGITIVTACAGHPARDGIHAAWRIAWRLSPLTPGRTVAEVGAHPAGILNTERLFAHVAFYEGDVSRALEVPPPWPECFADHTPGNCLVFSINGGFHGELR